MKDKLTQINDMAAVYKCKVWFDLIRRTFVDCDGKRTEIESWYIAKGWTRDEWRATFERVSGKKTAELWKESVQG